MMVFGYEHGSQSLSVQGYVFGAKARKVGIDRWVSIPFSSGLRLRAEETWNALKTASQSLSVQGYVFGRDHVDAASG